MQALVDRAYRRAKDLLQANMSALHAAAAALLERESLDGEELQALLLEQQAQQYLRRDAPEQRLPYLEPDGVESGQPGPAAPGRST